MLDELKSAVYRDKTVDILMEAVGGSDVRDMFLDSIEFSVLGAENDPQIKHLIDEIPAYEETDPAFEKELQAVTESFIPEAEY